MPCLVYITDEVMRYRGAIPNIQELKEAAELLFSSQIFQICLLISFSLLTHFFNLSEPQSIVFDEKYFIPVTHSYQEGEFFIDPHPPLGKLFLTVGTVLSGNTDYVSKDYIEENGYPAGYNITGNRVLPAVFGILLTPVIYLLVLRLTKSKTIAFTGGIMVAFENALIVQGTYTLFDSILIFFIFASLLAGFYVVSSVERWKYFWLIIASVCAGAAASTKLTGAAAIPLLLLLVFRWQDNWWKISFRNFLVSAGRVCLSLLVIGGVYLSTFAIHFSLIQKVGDGVHEYSEEYQNSLIQEDGSPPTTNPSFWHKLAEQHKATERYEKGVPALDLDKPEGEIGSHPSTWPLMGRVIGYYWRREAGDHSAYSYIYLFGNPVVWYLGLIGVILSSSLFVASQFLRVQILKWEHILLLLGYLINWVPVFFIRRVMYLYHYLTPLIFSILLFLMLLHMFFVIHRKPKQDQWLKLKLDQRLFITAAVVIALVLISFFVYAPFTYGLPISREYFDRVNLVKAWDFEYLLVE